MVSKTSVKFKIVESDINDLLALIHRRGAILGIDVFLMGIKPGYFVKMANFSVEIRDAQLGMEAKLMFCQ